MTLALWVCVADGKPRGTELSGVVSIADGGAFTMVRRDTVRTAGKGVTVLAGDMVQTGPAAFLAIQVQSGNLAGTLLGIGPSTAVYFFPAADVATLIVLQGWVKADIKSAAMRITGTRLGIQGRDAVVLLQVDQRVDAIFDEQGTATLLLRDNATTRVGNETRTNQFFVREEGSDVVSEPRPSSEFVQGMPIPFRDPLPEVAVAKLPKPNAPQLGRAVTYADIQTWLTMPRDWRVGFIPRFRARLKDPAFFAAMEAHLAVFPEWQDIVHPPPPPEPDRPAEGLRADRKPKPP